MRAPPTPLRVLAVLPLVLALVALAGCQSGRADTTGQQSDGFPAPDRLSVLDAAHEALHQQGFTPDTSMSSDREGVVVTRYKLSLAPFSGHGFREKATVRVHEVPGRENYYTAEVNVLREINGNMVQP